MIVGRDITDAAQIDASVDHGVVMKVHRGQTGTDPRPEGVELVVGNLGTHLLDADDVWRHFAVGSNCAAVERVVHDFYVARWPLRPTETYLD